MFYFIPEYECGITSLGDPPPPRNTHHRDVVILYRHAGCVIRCLCNLVIRATLYRRMNCTVIFLDGIIHGIHLEGSRTTGADCYLS